MAIFLAYQATALRDLKFKKISKQSHRNGAHNSDLPVASGSSTSTYQVPTQSRDGTAHPPYFASVAPRNQLGTILAPDSSPSAPVAPSLPPMDMTYKPHQSHFFSSVVPPAHQLPSLPRLGREADPLTAPSGFIRSAQYSKASDPPLPVASNLGKHLDDDDDDPGPPRKRINRRGSSANPIAIESSPETKRPVRLAAKTSPSRDDLSDWDSLPNPTDLLLGPTKSRLVRGRRPDNEQMDKGHSVELNTLIISHPDHSPDRVMSAFDLCDGDVKTATALIQDSTWHHELPSTSIVTPPPSTSATPSASSDSKKRAADKEKGKKSMIYAKRQSLSVTQANVSLKEPVQPAMDALFSPLGPKPSKRRVVQKQRIDSSGSEAEYSDGDDSDSNEGVFTQNRENEYYESEALKWLNECEVEALVELTGEYLLDSLCPLLMSCVGITLQQANTLTSLRPFPDAADFNTKLSRRNKTGLSASILKYCTEMFRGYKSVDDVLEGCERIGDQLKEVISKWTHSSVPTASTSKEATPLDDSDGALAIDSMPAVEQTDVDGDYISTQPTLLADTVQLKEYQLLGVNWMNLLYQRNLSCILADEMGALTPIHPVLRVT